jgi:hypothetical protein
MTTRDRCRFKRLAEPSLARMVASIPELRASSPGERSWSDSDRRQGDGHGANGGVHDLAPNPITQASLRHGLIHGCDDPTAASRLVAA